MDKINNNHLLRNLMTNEAIFIVNKKLMYTFGLKAGFILVYLMDQYNYLENAGKLQEDGSFYHSNEKLCMFSTLKESEMKKAKKELINAGVIKTKKKGIPVKTYYSICFSEIAKLLSTDKTIFELIQENFYTPAMGSFTLADESDLLVLERFTFRELRTLCSKEKIQYLAKDTKYVLMQKLIEAINPKLLDNFYKNFPQPSQKKKELSTVSGNNAHCGKMEVCATSTCEQDNHSPVSKKTAHWEKPGFSQKHSEQNKRSLVSSNSALNQEQRKTRTKNHDNHDRYDHDFFEMIFKDIGINYTKTNQAATKERLKTMKPEAVKKYIYELYDNILKNPNVKDPKAVFSSKYKKGECQVVPGTSYLPKDYEKRKKEEAEERASGKNIIKDLFSKQGNGYTQVKTITEEQVHIYDSIEEFNAALELDLQEAGAYNIPEGENRERTIKIITRKFKKTNKLKEGCLPTEIPNQTLSEAI